MVLLHRRILHSFCQCLLEFYFGHLETCFGHCLVIFRSTLLCSVYSDCSTLVLKESVRRKIMKEEKEERQTELWHRRERIS